MIVNTGYLVNGCTFVHPNAVVDGNMGVNFTARVGGTIVRTRTAVNPRYFVTSSMITGRTCLNTRMQADGRHLSRRPISIQAPSKVVTAKYSGLNYCVKGHSHLNMRIVVLPKQVVSPGARLNPHIVMRHGLPDKACSLQRRLVHAKSWGSGTCIVDTIFF